MKKTAVMVMAAMAILIVAGCQQGETVKVYNETTVNHAEGIDYYYNTPNCYVLCSANTPGREYAYCTNSEGVQYIKMWIERPDGPCGCNTNEWDCAWWNGDVGD